MTEETERETKGGPPSEWAQTIHSAAWVRREIMRRLRLWAAGMILLSVLTCAGAAELMAADESKTLWKGKWGPGPDQPVKPDSPVVLSEVIESHIDGTFTGWSGETIFKLVNGQIWQQSSYAYTYHYAYRPAVLIYGSGGTYKMKVEGVNGTINVKRLK